MKFLLSTSSFESFGRVPNNVAGVVRFFFGSPLPVPCSHEENPKLPSIARYGALSSIRCCVAIMIHRGSRTFPVIFAGQTAVHLPQCVQGSPSRSCFHVKS